MPYSGTAWSSTVQTVNYSTGGHTIEATGLGRVIIGKATSAAVSTDGGKTARGFTRVIIR